MQADYTKFQNDLVQDGILKDDKDSTQKRTQKLYWKQELIQKDESLTKLLQDNMTQDKSKKQSFSANDSSQFDAATFLYDLYKTCTVREIEQFKVLLREVQQDILQRDLKRNITDKVNENDGEFEAQNNIIAICEHITNISSLNIFYEQKQILLKKYYINILFILNQYNRHLIINQSK